MTSRRGPRAWLTRVAATRWGRQRRKGTGDGGGNASVAGNAGGEGGNASSAGGGRKSTTTSTTPTSTTTPNKIKGRGMLYDFMMQKGKGKYDRKAEKCQGRDGKEQTKAKAKGTTKGKA